MALIPYPECGREVSTRAAACPHCGCPLAETTSAAGVHVTAVSPAPVSSRSAIAELEQIAQDSQRSLLSPPAVQAAVGKLSARKRSLFSYDDAFPVASVDSGVLILSDQDVGLISTLASADRTRIRKLYAIGCTQLSDDLAGHLWAYTHLTHLDSLYCPNIEESGFAGSSFGDSLPDLRELYARSCPGVTMKNAVFRMPNLESAFLDGNDHPDYHVFEDVLNIADDVTLLSVHECHNITRSLGRKRLNVIVEVIEDIYTNCRIVG